MFARTWHSSIEVTVDRGILTWLMGIAVPGLWRLRRRCIGMRTDGRITRTVSEPFVRRNKIGADVVDRRRRVLATQRREAEQPRSDHVRSIAIRCSPNRADIARHHLMILTLEDRLFLAPIEDPKHILDVGRCHRIYDPSRKATLIDIQARAPAYGQRSCINRFLHDQSLNKPAATWPTNSQTQQ